VRLSPGLFVALNVLSAPPGVSVGLRPGYDGINVTGARPDGATVRVRTLYLASIPEAAVALSESQPEAGTTQVAVANAAVTPRADPVALVVTSRRGPAQGRRAVPRSRVFAPYEPSLPRADKRRLVLAAYYPWFGASDANSSQLADRPAGAADNYRYESVVDMVRQARANGIDGFAVSWQAGQEPYSFDLVVHAAEAAHSVVTAFVSIDGANARRDPQQPSDPETVTSVLRGALAADSSPAFLRSDGVPMLFVFDMNRLSPADWRAVRAGLAKAGTPAKLIGDGGWPEYADAGAGWDLYNPNPMSPDQLHAQYQFAETVLRAPAAVNPAVAPQIFVATVSPGFDDHRLRGNAHPVAPRGATGSRYADTWDAALRSHPDMILVTSWNEWFEGTAVEPGVASGDLALRQTARYSSAFKRASGPDGVP
jgi:hypothetical protein